MACTILRRMKLALTLFVAALVGGCSSTPARYAPLDVDHGELRDADNRVVILRGINARAEGLFDVTFDDGRAPLETVPRLEDEDIARMAALGFNLLRLPLSWSGLEPQRGVFAPAFLDELTRVVSLCRDHGVLVLLDLHQDAWSKEIGEDGAPLWAIQPPPAMLLGGPLTDLGDRRTSKQVADAFSSFFTSDADNLQEEFASMAQALAIRFHGDPAVLGFEIFNEPMATDDELLAFHTKVAQAIRKYDGEHLIAFEPPATRNFLDSASISSTPFPVGGAIYAPHLYTAVFGSDPRLGDDTYEMPLENSIRNARDEADAWDTPLLIGELGIGPQQPHALEWIGHALDGADHVFASTAFWLWKEQSQAQWGLFSIDADGVWHDRPDMMSAVSRPYVKAIGGTPQSMTWDGATLTLAFTPRAGVPTTHDVFFPGAAPRIACDGAPVAMSHVTVDAATSTYGIRCDGNELTVSRQ
jgi:endoglycosylceramidase